MSTPPRAARRAASAIAVVLAACAPPTAAAPGPAEPDEVARTSGERLGYAVARDCREPDVTGVIGRGQRWFDGFDPSSAGRPVALRRFHDDVVLPVASTLPSFAATAIGPACHGHGIRVEVRDWRDVDTAVEQLGAELRLRDLREEIAVGVAPAAI